MKIYCISGLGVDERAFSNLRIKKHTLVHIPWLLPKTRETLPQYAQRMMASISEDEPYAIMGLSFGGMISTEIAKHLKPERIFLISSIARYSELPTLFRFAGWLGLHHLLVHGVLKRMGLLNRYLLGTKDEKDKVGLKLMMAEMDPAFVKWAVNAILTWRNEKVPKCVRIHGNKDKLLPITSFDPHHIVENGTHFMISNRSKIVSQIIEKELKN